MQQFYTLKPVNTPVYVHVMHKNCMQHSLCWNTVIRSRNLPLLCNLKVHFSACNNATMITILKNKRPVNILTPFISD